MSTHNICFCGEIRKIPYFWIEKSALTSAMVESFLLGFGHVNHCKLAYKSKIRNRITKSVDPDYYKQSHLDLSSSQGFTAQSTRYSHTEPTSLPDHVSWAGLVL